MSALWTASDIAHAIDGFASGAWQVNGVHIDSRDVEPGCLFVALSGETTDGHQFLDAAFKNGASGAIVNQATHYPHVKVVDSFVALQNLAKAARQRLQGTVIAITGSVGKTGVKEALRLALERYVPGYVHASIRSFNNHVGVPLTLARMPAQMRFAVLEMGMNHAGELTALSALAKPDVAIITTVESAHLEFFQSEEAIADAKAEIFSNLSKNGTAIINTDNRHAERLLKSAKAEANVGRIITFGREHPADVRAITVSRYDGGSAITADIMGERLIYKIAQSGDHWVLNSLAVLAAVKAVDADLGLAGLALADMAGLAGRGQRLLIPTQDGGTALLLDESYNANPASMRAALAVLGEFERRGRRRVVILADMKELGNRSSQFHTDLANDILAIDIDELYLVGPEMKALSDILPRHIRHTHMLSADTISDVMQASLRHDDIVLVKGSNSMGLGKVIKNLYQPTIKAA